MSSHQAAYQQRLARLRASRCHFEPRELRFRLSAEGKLAYLDLIWAGPAMSSETFYTWEMDSMWVGGESSPLLLRKVIDRHGGEIWYQREKAAHRAFFRFVLPVATPEIEAEAEDHQRGGRPEYYDFDLFNFADKYAWACASVHATMRWKMP